MRATEPSLQHKRTLVLRVLRIDAKLAESASQHVNKRASSLTSNCQETPSLPLGLSLTAIAGPRESGRQGDAQKDVKWRRLYS